MRGMDRTTGQPIDDVSAHIAQSVTDILTTPIGSRIMRRDYGSVLPLLVDQPLTDATLLRAYSATVIALLTWEPRIAVRSIRKHVSTTAPGRVTLELTGVTDNGERIDVSAPLAVAN